MNRSVKVKPNLSPFWSLKKSIDQAYILAILDANAGSTFSLAKVSDSEPSKAPAIVLVLKVNGLVFLWAIIESLKSIT